MTSRYWLGMENVAPAGVAPRLLVAPFPSPLLAPPSLSVLADTVIARLIMASLQSGSLIAAMKPGDRLTNGSVSNNQTLARVFRPLMAGRLPELSWVKLVPLNCKVWACTEVGLPAGASSNTNRPLPSGTKPVNTFPAAPAPLLYLAVRLGAPPGRRRPWTPSPNSIKALPSVPRSRQNTSCTASPRATAKGGPNASPPLVWSREKTVTLDWPGT